MAQSANQIPLVSADLPRQARKRFLVRQFRRPSALLGLVLAILIVLFGFVLPGLWSLDPVDTNSRLRFAQPFSHGRLLGADNFGRDMLARLVYGTRTSVSIAAISILLAHSIGGILGGLSAYFRRLDLVLQRLLDLTLMIPVLILALVIVAVRGQSQLNVVIAITVAELSIANRVVRSVVLVEMTKDYVVAEEAVGATWLRIVWRHLLPQAIGPWLVVATVGIGTAVVLESSLSFIGLGVPVNTPSLGGMLSGSTVTYIGRQPWNGVFPGALLMLIVLSANLLGEGVRDALDPRRRR
jgi:peptide/nickel transport system permease protein